MKHHSEGPRSCFPGGPEGLATAVWKCGRDSSLWAILKELDRHMSPLCQLSGEAFCVDFEVWWIILRYNPSVMQGIRLMAKYSDFVLQRL